MLPLPNALIETWFSTGDTASLHLYSKSSSLLTLLEAHPGFSPSLMYSQPSLSRHRPTEFQWSQISTSFLLSLSLHLPHPAPFSICPQPSPLFSFSFWKLLVSTAPLTLFWIQSMTQQLPPVAKSRRLSFSFHFLVTWVITDPLLLPLSPWSQWFC